MSAQDKVQKNVDPTDTFDENPGIIQRFLPVYSQADLQSDDVVVERQDDPVQAYRYETRHPPRPKTPKAKEPKPAIIEPSISTRLQLKPFPPGEVGVKYVVKDTKSMRELKEKNKMHQAYQQVEFCDYEVLRLPSPVILDTISRIEEESPNVSKAKVIPTQPSDITSSFMLPPTKSSLERREIRSGIFINEPSEESSVTDEEDVVVKKKKKKKRKVYKKRPKRVPFLDRQGQGDIKDYTEAVQDYYAQSYVDDLEEEEYREPPGPLMFSKSTHVSDNLILGRFADMMSNASSATSMQDKSEYEDLSWCEIPLTSRLVQTLRDAQCEKPKKKYKKGCLENHSFTKLKQSILTDFPHYTVNGTLHQGDICFPKISRNNQGICMPIAAFCYGQIKKPKEWTPRSIDEILEIGNCLFMESIAEMHLHKGRKELSTHEVQKMVFIGEKKVKYEISDPEVKGLIRSTDKRIFNVSKGLKVFFCKYNAGILRTDNLNLLICKMRRGCYLFFDANPRKNNLFQDKNGMAVMCMVQRLKAIRSILLDRSNIGNSHFNICQIKTLKVMDKDEREEDAYIKERNTYIAMNERQAVVQGSFDLGDLCFLFNRNKQALSMSVIALAYSRISVPHCWHRKTLDKILIIGNQLHSLIIEAENCPTVGIEHLPAIFTVGPYVLEIHIYPNRYADLMYKKSNCMFLECMKDFFEENNNCIAQIGKSYIAVWQQRDMFFCFDPYTRNKEGLKCRQGAACVTMNKDIDTMVETILVNFENREAIFHLHAIKLIRIHRDPDLSKFFPKHLSLHEVPIETFHKHKCMKSKKRAVEKPFATANFKEHALKKLLAGMSPGDSMYDIQSNIGSIMTHMLPSVECPKTVRTPKPKKREPEDDHIIDLDSPSLSDTQIVPKRPNPYDDEIKIDDLASFGLTQEEKELEEVPEGQEGVPLYGEEALDEAALEEETYHSRYGFMSQVTSGELDPCFRADYINTDLTYCYRLLPALELPMRTREDRDIVIDPVQQDKEMGKMRNYEKLDDDTQILVGVNNAFDIVLDADPNLIIPYMCIMAAAYDLEKPIYRWDRVTVGFVIKAGRMLYEQYCESFIHIDDFRFELLKNTIMATVEIIFNTYIGDGLFDTFSGQKVLEDFIDKHVFNQQNVGFVIVPHYACTVFFKKNLFYLFDPYNCDTKGNVLLNDKPGKACVMRFRSFDDLIKRLVQNLSRRVEENDQSGMQFRMLILAKPNFQLDGIPQEEISLPTELEVLMKTQSEEFKRPSNYIKLPDGSQLIRGNKHVGDYGPEVEYIAPYICVMAVTVGEKYAIRTWSADVLDFIMQGGDVLYRKAKYSFVQLTKLEIPKISLGKDDFKVQVRYVFDAPVNMRIMRTAIRKVIEKERDWIFIVTEVYTCAVCQRRGIFYLYNPFSCNELGLDDFSGFSSIARFREINDLCLRIVFNKSKRDKPEEGAYSRFALYVCRVARRPKSQIRMKYPGEELDKEMTQYGGAEDTEKEDVEEEEELVPRTRHGFVKVTNVEVIEGTKALERPPQDQVELLEDHFASLAAALMVIHKPLEQWSTKNVDKSLSLGKHIYNHADSLEQARKRTIRNILIGKYFFDVIIKWVEIEDYRHRRTFRESLNYIMRKRKFIIVQTGEGTYVIYLDTDNKLVHLFHPYPATFKGKKNNPDEDVSNACWIKFKNIKQMIRFLKQTNNMNRFKYYTFSVINVTKAPRSIIVSSMIQDWIRAKQAKGEPTGKSFHEHESWMDLHENPWARLGADLSPIKGVHNKWFSWDIEYNNDLYILCGTMNEHSRSFRSELRGKQTICNLVTVIGMTGIYDLKEWNPSVIDAVMINGYKYFLKCTEDISEAEHEFAMGDLLEECEIFPFKFQVRHQPIIEGTMFITSTKRFNLYRALRFFFDEYYYRAGIIITSKNDTKKMVAFAKRKDNEFYMFDCQTFGKPMFAPHTSFAYMLRCTTLARLIHILVLTLRGGDFYIYEVIADNYRAMQGDLNPYVDEKPKLKP